MSRDDIIDGVLARMHNSRRKRWHDRVAAEHHDTLAAVRKAYHDGKFGSHKRPASKAISEYLRECGIADVGDQGVLQWLESQ